MVFPIGGNPHGGFRKKTDNLFFDLLSIVRSEKVVRSIYRIFPDSYNFWRFRWTWHSDF